MDQKEKPKPCTHCQKPAADMCAGCSGAPVYNQCISKPTLYCSLICQKDDWCKHEPGCRNLQARKTLGRAASLLQAIIYRIRLHASPLEFESMRSEGSAIYLEGYPSGRADLQPQLGPFPLNLDGDRSTFEAVWCSWGAWRRWYIFITSLGNFWLVGLVHCPYSPIV